MNLTKFFADDGVLWKTVLDSFADQRFGLPISYRDRCFILLEVGANSGLKIAEA